ncbi:tetratricopeptide repeat protein [Pseudoxanthomonas dokdonensis]|uniref:protein O-GlcNAc transferase n=1 Tax=Pseudoxanthomonas dokdonensis TaxID=344882 RepID=A0A0R0CCI0_9GAMM|nr:tetratricopeptide repeat protein [Pseudoxanthomonas dokdonensis]KRG67369.1 UDP-N-acetylglucosamine--peptide N-acetylglucosaminyltransferase SPINDLY [Pseudoxanthomonas dokdonensis]
MSEPSASLQHLRHRVVREPGNALAWLQLADAEFEHGDLAQAEAACQHALQQAPGHPEVLARLGRVYWKQGQLQSAYDALMRAATQAPRHPGIAVWLAHVLEDLGQAEDALLAYRHAHALVPDQPQLAAYLLAWQRRLCDWRELPALARQVRQAVADASASVEPFAFLSEDSSAAEQLQCARLRARGLAASTQTLAPSPPAGERARLSVGFLSNGFGAHPTGLLTVALFEAVARGQPRLDLHLFALNDDDGSLIRRRLQACTTLHDVGGRSHQQTAQAIRAAGVEVLFDLRGWGGGGAPEVLAMRPAPVQVNWLAYPGTSGAPWLDYLLADDYVLPPSLESCFSEQVIRLPRCFQPSDSNRVVPAPPSRLSCGLPPRASDGAGTVFCCFNNSYKLNPRSVDRALAVLQQVPGSVLWLLSGPGHADQRLRAHAQARGIDPQRLVFMAKQPHADYLARLQLADLFLDTDPYNAHTTASDALWVGCPLLTTPGQTFASRVAGSLNHHLGMAEMNVEGDQQFIATAVALARDPAALTAVRERLARQRQQSGLFDMDGFAADFADTVARIARR